MGSDLRTSARDLLSLAHKVNVLLQRRSDKLHGDIDSDDTLAEVETGKYTALNLVKLRQRMWETTKLLKSALDHVEDIEDEDEPRILREAMDALQIPVREALQGTHVRTQQPSCLNNAKAVPYSRRIHRRSNDNHGSWYPTLSSPTSTRPVLDFAQIHCTVAFCFTRPTILSFSPLINCPPFVSVSNFLHLASVSCISLPTFQSFDPWRYNGFHHRIQLYACYRWTTHNRHSPSFSWCAPEQIEKRSTPRFYHNFVLNIIDCVLFHTNHITARQTILADPKSTLCSN
ncbi:hypothetical protein BG003_006718 [Podila horticola]|nr:hypothetical protein BG003_006718 [Podila horticola]